MMSHAAFSAVIDRLRIRPLQQPEVAEVFGDLKRKLGLDPAAGTLRTFLRLLVHYVKAEANAPFGQADLAFQIAFHEQLGGKQLRDRCAMLSKATQKSYSLIRAAIIGSLLALPILEGCILYTLVSLARLQTAGSTLLALFPLLLPLNAIFLNPALSPALCILYFRARQANGEDVALSGIMPTRL
jgi:hypothetical protein